MKKQNRSPLLLLTVALLTLGLLLAACGGAEPTPTPEPPPPTDTPVPPPTDTPVPPPTDTPPPPPPTDTPVPPPTDTPPVNLETLDSAEGGYTIQFPGNWFSSETFGFATIASAEELMDSPDPGEEGGVVVVVSGDTADFSDASPAAALQEVIDDFGITDDMEVVEGPTEMMMNGQPGAWAIIKGTSDNGTPLFSYAAIAINGERTAIMFGVTPADTEKEFRPIFEMMAQTLTVTEPIEVTAPPVDVPDSLGLLLYGDVINGEIAADGAAVWTFLGVAGETIDIIVEPTDDQLDVVVDVVDADGNSIIGGELDDAFDLEEVRGLSLPSSGEFSIVLRGFAGSGGPYQLTIMEAGTAVAPPPLPPGGSTIAYGNTVPGSITGDAGVSWSFAGSAGDFVNVTAAPFDGFDLTLDILGPNGLSVVEGPIDGSFDTEHIRTLELLEDGFYTIVVEGFDGQIGDFEVTVDLVNGGLPGNILFAFGALDEADSASGQPFPFTASGGEMVAAYLDPDFDAVLQVYNDDTDELLLEVDDSTGFEEIIFITPESDATNYYFNVVGFEGDFGEYNFTMAASDLVLLELAYGDEIVGTFNTDGVMTYAFNGTAGNTLEITVATNDEVDLVIDILDVDDNILDSADVELSGGAETLTFTFETDGLYFINIGDFFQTGGAFSLFLN